MSGQAKSPLLRRLLSLLNDDSEKIKGHDDSRRNFLKSGIIVTAGITAGLSPEYLLAANKLQPRIAIIGAGLAGLSCAWELKKSGIEATITRPIIVPADVFNRGSNGRKNIIGLSWAQNSSILTTKPCLVYAQNWALNFLINKQKNLRLS